MWNIKAKNHVDALVNIMQAIDIIVIQNWDMATKIGWIERWTKKINVQLNNTEYLQNEEHKDLWVRVKLANKMN
jgi:hypothetical protein